MLLLQDLKAKGFGHAEDDAFVGVASGVGMTAITSTEQELIPRVHIDVGVTLTLVDIAGAASGNHGVVME